MEARTCSRQADGEMLYKITQRCGAVTTAGPDRLLRHPAGICGFSLLDTDRASPPMGERRAAVSLVLHGKSRRQPRDKATARCGKRTVPFFLFSEDNMSLYSFSNISRLKQ